MREGLYQTAILHYLAYLEAAGKVYFIRNNSFAGFIQRANGSVGRIKNNKKGTPDILVCYKGCFIGIEVKGPKGRQTPEQKEAQLAIEKAGGLYWLVHDVTEVEEKISLLERSVSLDQSQS